MKTEQETRKGEERKAILFLNTMRGQYVMGQALAVAIQTFESQEPEYLRESSDISDMQYLLDTLFSIGKLAMQTPKGKAAEEVTDEN